MVCSKRKGNNRQLFFKRDAFLLSEGKMLNGQVKPPQAVLTNINSITTVKYRNMVFKPKVFMLWANNSEENLMD